jgi:hypothetical protein
MMKRYLLVLGLLAVLGGWGCSMVTSSRPVGDTPVLLDPSDWEGTWTAADGGPVVVRVEDARKGRLRLAWMEGDREMALKTADVMLLKAGTWHFANLREETKEGPPAYLFARVKKEKGLLIIWPPRPEQFARLINDKVLPGTVSKEKILLGELGPEHMKIIVSEDRGVLFDWGNPIVLIRTGNR